MKKVLSIVLSIAMVVCLAPTMAFAATTSAAQADAAYSDTEGKACEGAVNVLSALGVVDGFTDGTYKPEQTVTRAQMAKLIVAALGVSEYATAKNSSYTDMGSAQWAIPVVEYATNLGIINGVGNGKFAPNKTVTYEQVATMICRALGYTTASKEMNGTYPAVFVQKARALGILENVQGYALGTGANRGDCAIMLYNALDLAQVYADADGVTRTKAGSDAGEYNGTNGTGYVTMMGTLNKSGNTSYGVLTDTDADKAVFNVNSYVGAAAKIVKNKNNEVIALGDIKTTFLTGDFDKDDQTFTVGDTEYKLNPSNIYTKFRNSSNYAADATVSSSDSSDIKYFYNGEVTTKASEQYPLSKDQKNITLACVVDGKTITAVYSIAKWDNAIYKMATSSDKTTISKNQKLYGYEFDTDKNGDIDASSYILEGVESLDKIAEDNVLEIYVGKDNKINKLCVGTKTVEGTLSKVINVSNDDKSKLTIEGTTYKCYKPGNGVTVSHDSDSVAVGDKVKAYLTSGNQVYKIEQNASASNYGVIIDLGESEGSYANDVTFELKMITADGSKKAYVIDDDFVDDNDGNNGVKYFNKSGKAWSAGKAGDFIKYSINSNGEIDDMTILNNTATKQSKVKDTVGNGSAANDKITKSGTYNGIMISDSAVIYTTKLSGNQKLSDFTTALSTKTGDYSVSSKKALLDSEKLDARYVVKDNQIVAMLISDGSVSTEKIYGVITEIGDIKDDDYGTEVKALVNGEEKTYLVKKSVTINENTLYRFKLDTKGNIEDVVDANTAESGKNALLGEVRGSKTGIEIKNNGITANNKTISLASSPVVYKWNSDDKVFEVGTIADVESADANTVANLYDSTATKSSPDGTADIILVIPASLANNTAKTAIAQADVNAAKDSIEVKTVEIAKGSTKDDALDAAKKLVKVTDNVTVTANTSDDTSPYTVTVTIKSTLLESVTASENVTVTVKTV